MVAQKLTRWLSTYFSSSAEKYLNIQPAKRFQEIVDRERKRAERGKYGFTLLVFWVKEPEQREVIFESMDSAIGRRIRSTDVAGFIGKNRIGILLWDTQMSLGDKVARKYQKECPVLIHCSYDLYEYPLNFKDDTLNELDDSEDSNEDDHFDDGGAPSNENGEGVPSSEKNKPKETVLACSSNQDDSENQESKIQNLIFSVPMPWWKRSIDFVGAAVGLLILSPLLAVTAIAIKITAPGPVFFTQPRAGKNGKPFTMYKFRTMVVDAEAQKASLRAQSEQDGPAFKMKHDPRITPIGKYLRKTCIDELPQLINVLKGDMSLVGPRPLPVDEADQITGWQRRRIDVTPGLTCIWQIEGKSAVSFTEWMRMDIRYIRARNLFQDMTLITRTIFAVILHKASN